MKNILYDEWWAEVMKIGHYPTLCKVTAGAISIFYGPHVESSFNTMGDVDDSSTRMNIVTYSSIQIVKYALRANSAKGQTLIDCFSQKDILYDRIDSNLIINIGWVAKTKRLLEDRQKMVQEKPKK